MMDGRTDGRTDGRNPGLLGIASFPTDRVVAFADGISRNRSLRSITITTLCRY